jgi:hypothetical protein
LETIFMYSMSQAQFLSDSGPSDLQEGQEVTARPFRLFSDAGEAPLRVMRACLLQGSWQGLVIEGNPPAELIAEAGLSIYSEYCEALGGHMIKGMLGHEASAEALRGKIARVADALAVARSIRAPEASALFLKDFPREAKAMQEANTDEEYFRILDRIDSMSKAWHLQLERDRISEPTKTASRTPREIDAEIDQVLIAIEEMMRREINDDITVRKYCAYVKRLRERNKPKPAPKA